jgi:hypothetical protein
MRNTILQQIFFLFEHLGIVLLGLDQIALSLDDKPLELVTRFVLQKHHFDLLALPLV